MDNETSTSLPDNPTGLLRIFKHLEVWYCLNTPNIYLPKMCKMPDRNVQKASNIEPRCLLEKKVQLLKSCMIGVTLLNFFLLISFEIVAWYIAIFEK